MATESNPQAKPSTTLPLGSLWAFPAASGTEVVVLTPQGEELRVVGYEGTALVVMTEPGVYTCGEHSVTAKA